MLDKDVKELNEQTADKNDHIIIAVRRLYIQEFAEANCGRELTEAELEELTWMVWEESWHLDEWLDEAIRQIIPKEEIARHNEQMSKECHKTKKTISKKAIIYCRTACKEQENKNLEMGQLEVCLTFAGESGNFEILGAIVDEGKSGIDKKHNRLEKLFEILKAKKVEVLITYDTHRISRNYQEYENFKRLLETTGIELITATPDLYKISDRVTKHYENCKKKVKQTN